MKRPSSPGPAAAAVLLSCAVALVVPGLAAQGSPPLLPPPPPPPSPPSPPSPSASTPLPAASASAPPPMAPLPPPPPPPAAAAPAASGSSPYGWAYPPPWVYPSGSSHTASPYAPAPPPPPESRKIERWYGWQIYLVDGGWMLLGLATSGGSSEKTLGNLAGFTYLLGAPIVHWAHGHVGKGFASAGLRVGLPLAGFAAGYGLGSALTRDDWGQIGFAVVGGLGGFVSAIVLDAQVLARDEIDEPAQASRLRVVPSLSLGSSKATLGLSGAF